MTPPADQSPPSAGHGLLIINADDWGRTTQATNSILSCIKAERVTSTSGMVHMVDSVRAANLAQRHGLSVGLHLNLTELYTAPQVPENVRTRQERLVRFFRRNRWTVWTYNPLLVGSIRACIQHQLEAFRMIYGHEPSHINGHHHVHTSPSVLLSGSLPRGLKVRRTFTFLPGEKPLPNRLARIALNYPIARRSVCTTYFFHLDTFVRAVNSNALKVDLDTSIEVLTHPESDEEWTFLMSDTWMRVIAGFELASYDRLQA